MKYSILTPFFCELTEEDKMYCYFMQDSAMAHTANFLMTVLKVVFGKQFISL